MDYVKAPVEFTIFVLENLIHERVERTFMLRFSAHVNSQIYYEPKKKIGIQLVPSPWDFNSKCFSINSCYWQTWNSTFLFSLSCPSIWWLGWTEKQTFHAHPSSTWLFRFLLFLFFFLLSDYIFFLTIDSQKFC